MQCLCLTAEFGDNGLICIPSSAFITVRTVLTLLILVFLVPTVNYWNVQRTSSFHYVLYLTRTWSNTSGKEEEEEEEEFKGV